MSTSIISEVSSQLDLLDRQGAHWNEMLVVLQRIPDVETLWRLLTHLTPSLPIARMVYRRAVELGASEDRAKGYLAGIHQFFADNETSAAITGQHMPKTTDTELLLAWASVDWEAQRHIERLQLVLPYADDPKRIWAAMASTAARTDNDAIAAEAYRWLVAHESDEKERRRLLDIMQERKWL
jgi:hypothetical protein